MALTVADDSKFSAPASDVGLAAKPCPRVYQVLVVAGMVLSLWPGVPPWAPLLGGCLIGLRLGRSPWPQLKGLSRRTLQLAVVGIGAGVNFNVLTRVGVSSIAYTFVGLVLTFLVGMRLASWLGVNSRVGALIFAGTGICGGSAIAAVAPAIGAKSEEVSAALSTVFMLNAIALLAFPTLGVILHLSPNAYALWCALAIHDTSSVVGAAIVGGPAVLATATTVKLVRSLWIVPVALSLGFWFRRRQDVEGDAKVKIPWFIGGFVILSAFFTAYPQFTATMSVITLAAHSLLTFTLFLIGLEMNWRVWRTVGFKALWMGILLWICVGVGTLLAIEAGWIT